MPVTAVAEGRSPSSTTPAGAGMASPPTALTGTTTLIAPWLIPR